MLVCGVVEMRLRLTRTPPVAYGNNPRHSRAGGNPSAPWIPACAGMTIGCGIGGPEGMIFALRESSFETGLRPSSG